MYVKLKSGQYYHTGNGHMWGVKEAATALREKGWRVWVSSGLGTPQHVVEEGYTSQKDAQNALDEFMSDKDFVQVNPPVTDEEMG